MQVRASSLAGATGAGVGAAFNDLVVWGFETSTSIDIPSNVEVSLGVIIIAGVALFSAALAPHTPAPVAGELIALGATAERKA